LFVLPAVNAVPAAGQSSELCITTHSLVLYTPESNLKGSELETLRRAKVSVDVAMYSFSDHELAEGLIGLARLQ